MAAALTVAEVHRHEKVHSFSACRHAGYWLCAWAYTRGRFPKGSADGGTDLLVQRHGAQPRKVITGSPSLSSVVWSPGSAHFAVQSGKELVLGSTSGLKTQRWVQLPVDETFLGLPAWAGPDVLLFATTGGTPECARLHAVARPPGCLHRIADEWVYIPKGGPVDVISCEYVTVFIAEPLSHMMSWDHSPTAPLVALVHQRANNAVADVVLVPGIRIGSARRPRVGQPHVVAMDGAVEYCTPQVRFLADGRLAARLNLAEAAKTWNTQRHTPLAVTHGLWLLDIVERNLRLCITTAPVHVMVDRPHGSYNVYSGSYSGDHGVLEGFILSEDRTSLAVAARPQTPQSAADTLFVLTLPNGKYGGVATGTSIAVSAGSGKGCHVPIALGGDAIVYHFRSPTQWGDLWLCDVSRPEKKATQLTRTMPRSLQKRLSQPEEVVVENPESGGCFHALLFQPPSGTEDEGSSRQPLVWAHGGPSLHYSYDYNPFLSWLASLGFVVLAPNFRGSTGFGVDFMRAVLGEGCGVADVSDCAACVGFLRALQRHRPQLRVDLSKGVGIAGHSWGGYVSLMCLLRQRAPGHDTNGVGEPLFSCAVASAAITDWAVQQSDTYASAWTTHSLLGGCVRNDAAAAERGGRVAPLTYAGDLRAPLLLLHGEEDVHVPFEQCRRFAEAARRAAPQNGTGQLLELVAFPGEGHGMRSWSSSTQEEAMRRIADFLRTRLKQGWRGRKQLPPAALASQPAVVERKVPEPVPGTGPPPVVQGSYAPHDGSGWQREQSGGQWLFSEEEGLYFHVPTGSLFMEGASDSGVFTRVRGGQTWRVIGGDGVGGIVVRTGREFDSPKESERLSMGALVVELEREGERLRYRRITGEGPVAGWVSARVAGKDLLVKTEPGLRDVEGGHGFGKQVQLRVTELFEEALDLEWSVVDCEEPSLEASPATAAYPAVVEMVLDKEADSSEVCGSENLRPPKGAFVKRVECELDSQVTISSMPEGRSFLVSVLLAFEGQGRLRSSWARVSTLSPNCRPSAATTLDPTGSRRARGVTQRCDGFVDYGRVSDDVNRKVRCRRCGCDYDLHEIAYGQ